MMTQDAHSHLGAGAGQYDASSGCFPSVSNLVATIALLFAEWNRIAVFGVFFYFLISVAF